jgi:cellulose synthase/poly-beta-1,6-N-acetylglucosamine synthase-like glycosyltransferase
MLIPDYATMLILLPLFIFLYIASCLLFAYAVLMACFSAWWKKMPVFSANLPVSGGTGVKVSVIIPARNEEYTIGNCLNALRQQSYPGDLLEIIVVNDHSTDNTEAVVRKFNHPGLSLISLTGNKENVAAPKKGAIEAGIAAAKGELIITTDADCTASPEWVSTIVGFYRSSRTIFIAAPVKMNSANTLLSKFQALDFLTMQGITGATAYKKILNMCNGANLAYTKKVFEEVKGFAGIDGIASGDDMLLMNKIAKIHPLKTGFIKSAEAIVATTPERSWKGFLNQRIRWASKATHYREPVLFLVLLLVYATNFFLLLTAIAALIRPVMLLYFVLLCLIKFITEFFFVNRVAAFFGQRRLLPWLLLLQPLHILYIVVSGFLGQVKTYSWKDRKLR